MAYTLQLADARNSLEIKAVAGVCTTSDDFLSMLNQAQRRLIERGNWFGTEWIVKLCVYNGCVTWPRYVSTVLGVRFCCLGNVDIRNNWYRMSGPNNCSFGSWDHTISDNGTSPIYNEIMGTAGVELWYSPTKLEDVGKKVVVFGTDPNGQPLQEKVNGVWRRGKTVTATATFVPTGAGLVQKITSVSREISQSNMQLFGYDAASLTFRDLAIWEPTETHPAYRRSLIKGFKCIPSNCPVTDGVKLVTIEAMVKLAFVPAVNDEDFLAIEDMTALAFMIAAIRLEESNQDAAAEIKTQKAIQSLNFRDRNLTPGQQVVVNINPVGHGIWSPI